MTVATPTGLVATVDVAHEASWSRIGSRTDASDLRVLTGVPLRLALLVGEDPTSLAAARAAALGACADVVLTLSVERRAAFVDRASALRDARPDAVLVVAGPRDTGGIVDLVEALRAGCGGQAQPPAILVAADERARERVAASAAPLAIEAIPSLGGPLTAHAREAIVARLRGIRRSGGDVVLRDEAIEAAARSLALATDRNTLVVDVSGASTSLAFAGPSGLVAAAHSHLGVGAGADRVVARTGLDRVRRWIPWAIDAPALLERVFNRARWPDAIPPSVLTLAIEMSLAREAIAQLLHEAERAGLDVGALRATAAIACTGRLARFPRPAQTVLAAIDAVAPEGMLLVAREKRDALVAAGAIASRSSADVEATLEPLALVATLWPKRQMTVTVSDGHGATTERVARGAFFLMPTTGAAELRLTGIGDPARTSPLGLGIVVDARGRPLELPLRDAERLPTLARWYAALATLPIAGGAR